MRISKIIHNRGLQKQIFQFDRSEFQSINPANNQLIKKFEQFGKDKVEEILANSTNSYKKWRILPLSDRLNKFEKLAENFEKRKDELAKLITVETVINC